MTYIVFSGIITLVRKEIIMSQHSPTATIDYITEDELMEVQESYPDRVTLKSKWSYNGEITSQADLSFEDIDRMNNDEEFAYNILMRSNRRDI
jgi:hypothetical protein